jgi:hypothetical protein
VGAFPVARIHNKNFRLSVKCPSYARLGEIQAVYQPHLEPEKQKLLPDVLPILQGQIRFLLTGDYSGDYELYREQLLQPQGHNV